MATGGTPELIAQLTNAEAHRILSEIAALSTNLEQLVHESVSSVLLQRTPPAAAQNGGAPAAPGRVVPREARLDILHHARPLDQRELWR